MLELDIGVTKDNKVIVMHDTTVDGKTNGSGTVASFTLRGLKRLDAAYWFAPRARDHYSHDLPRKAYRFRGIATGKRKPPKGFRAADFRVPTLRQVMRAFPRTPINIEIKGRTPAETDDEYVQNAEVLAALLENTKRRDLIVVSFKQPAVGASTSWCRGSTSRRASRAWPTGCSREAHPVRAWRPSRSRSPSGWPGH
jgi:glycerophosphoryl diester phosphodiesterase